MENGNSDGVFIRVREDLLDHEVSPDYRVIPVFLEVKGHPVLKVILVHSVRLVHRVNQDRQAQ